jgi:outer membrane protein insertion porin family
MIMFKLKVAASVLALAGLGTTALALRAVSQPGEQIPSMLRPMSTDEGMPAPGAKTTAAQPRLARSQAAKFPQGPISKIEFEGNATITPDKIKPKLLSRVGQPLDQYKVETDLKTLMETLWFSDVRWYLENWPPNSGKYGLIFVVREIPLITKVEFRGRKAIRLEEIEDVTGLKVGNRADPTRTRMAVRQILRLYHEKGHKLASVTLKEGGNVGDTKIVIEIFEGPKVRVKSIDFVGNHFATSAQLRTQISARHPTIKLTGEYHSETPKLRPRSSRRTSSFTQGSRS